MTGGTAHQGTQAGSQPLFDRLEHEGRALETALDESEMILGSPGSPPIMFFFDTNVIYPTVFGLRWSEQHKAEAGPDLDPRRWKVQALWWNGYLMPANLLPPHQEELLRPFADAEQGEGAAFRRNAVEVLGEAKVERLETMAASAGKSPQAQQAFQRALDELAVPIFIRSAFELRSWKGRLNDLLDTNRLRWPSDELFEDLPDDDPLYKRIRAQLDVGDQGLDPSKRHPENNRRDARALAQLAALVRSRPKERFRFYTHSDKLKKIIWNDPEVSRALSDDKSSASPVSDSPGSVLRSTLYLEWLALVLQVKVAGRALASGQDGAERYPWGAALRDLPARWAQMVRTVATMRSGEFSSEQRSELLINLRQFSAALFFRTVWMDGQSVVHELMHTSGRSSLMQVWSTVQQVQAKPLETLIRKLAERSAEQPKPDPRPAATRSLRASRDTGMVRWVAPPYEEMDRIAAPLLERTESKAHPMYAAAIEEAKAMLAEGTNSVQAAAGIAALINAGRYSELSQLLVARAGRSPLEPGLELLRLTALVKGQRGDARAAQQVQPILDLAARHRSRHLWLGAAHALYQVDLAMPTSTPDVIHRSLECATKALDPSAPDMISAFARDHVCFLKAGVLGIPLDEAEFLALAALKHTESWNYRFEDTRLVCDLQGARQQFKSCRTIEDLTPVRGRVVGIVLDYDILLEQVSKLEIVKNANDAKSLLNEIDEQILRQRTA